MGQWKLGTHYVASKLQGRFIQAYNEANPKSTTIVDTFVSPPLPRWKELCDLPEPSGPLPEEDEGDATSKEEALKPKEIKEAKDSEQGDKGEK
ncbi:hypothetical protein J4E91_001403 [Alternaria rosae]|nr:hypothetical protein J4E91_001403 [Alternaria rosae]